jgi:hypothetical protein
MQAEGGQRGLRLSSLPLPLIGHNPCSYTEMRMESRHLDSPSIIVSGGLSFIVSALTHPRRGGDQRQAGLRPATQRPQPVGHRDPKFILLG